MYGSSPTYFPSFHDFHLRRGPEPDLVGLFSGLVCLVIPNGTLFEAFALSFDLVCSLLLSKADILNEGP